MRRAIWSASALLLAVVSFGAGRFSSFRPFPEIVATLPGDESEFSREFDDRLRERFPIGSSEDKLLAFLANENFFPDWRRRDNPNSSSSFKADLYARKSFACSGAPTRPGFSRTSGAHTKASAYERVRAKSKAGSSQIGASPRRTQGVSNASPLAMPRRTSFSEWVMHLVVIGGSDAGISAALRAQELEPGAEITVLVADDYPNFSICGLPYFLSGETPDWHDLAHRSEFPGLNILRRHLARRIDASDKTISCVHAGAEMTMRYDRLVIATRAKPVDPISPEANMRVCFCCIRWMTVSRSIDT